MVSSHAIFINNFYQKPDFKLKPFYNSYKDFFENIKHKSHFYSIIPEYNASNFDSAGFSAFDSNYLKLLGREKFSSFSENSGTFIIDFNKFSSNDSNKIKFSFKGVKKLLPYKGFYPSDRSLQIANLFSKAYFESLSRGTKLTEYEKQTLLNPFFAPGILYNTIKSGIAVEHPIFTSSQELWLEKASNQSVFQHAEAIGSFYTEIKETANSLGLGSERIPFETILNPEPLFSSAIKNLNYINTTYFSSGSIVLSGSNTNIVAASNRYVVPTIDIEQRIKPYLNEYALEKRNYQKAINNYLSEIPNFFLKNKFFTSFISKPESSFPILDKDVVYKMQLQITKDPNFKLFDTADPILNYGAFGFERSLFGPLNGEHNTISYGPSIFCPPYIGNIANEGSEHRTLTVSFKAPETKKFTLKEIFANLTASVPYPQAYMSLEACLNLKQSVPFKNLTFVAVSALPKETIFNQNDNVWVIQTKFECPIINYDNGLLVNTGTIPTRNDIPAVASVPYYNDSNVQQGFRTLFAVEYDAKGIWNSLGRLADESSLQLKLYSGEAPYERTKVGGTQSLLDALGFQTETKNLSELADLKEISEAVVILPFCSNFASLTGIIKSRCFSYSPTEVGNHNLFAIPASVINSLLFVQDYTKLSIEDIKKILETNPNIDSSNSVVSLMKKMVNYNIPPHLNWLLNKEIKPIVMYIAEFESSLSKQDLANIWQGTMPTIAEESEEQEIAIEHFISKNELFGYDLGTSETPIEIFKKFEIKGKVFKVKKRANTNYYKLTANTEDDARFAQSTDDWYSYNWPYDYFSLVELVNIQAGEAKGAIQQTTEAPVTLSQNPIENVRLNQEIRNAVDEFVNGIRLNNT